MHAESSNLQMERKRGWLEKELEMLYAVMQQQSPVQPLKITNEAENSVPKREEPLLQPIPTASTAQITDAEESPKFNVIAVPPKRSSLSSSLTSSMPLKSGPVCLYYLQFCFKYGNFYFFVVKDGCNVRWPYWKCLFSLYISDR